MLKIYIRNSPQQFLENIKNEIQSNNIKTWVVNEDGVFTHTSVQWKDRAWVKVKNVTSNPLEFSLLGREEEHLSDEIRGVYWGNFSQMIVTHFRKDFNLLEIRS